jgi:hypothetical protein
MDKVCSSSAPPQSSSGHKPEGVQLISSSAPIRLLSPSQVPNPPIAQPYLFVGVPSSINRLENQLLLLKIFSYYVTKIATVVKGNVKILAT